MTRWWQFGLFGGIVLSIATVVKVIRAIFRGKVEWGEDDGFAAAIFGMGFLCGVIVWAGKGLHQRLGMVGDAIVGLVVMVAFFISCMLLFEPELLGAKFQNGGLPMLEMAVVLGPLGGAWTGRDLRTEASPPAERYSTLPKQPAADNNLKDAKVNPMGRPFMEHPSSDFETAVEAIADAIKRLRALPAWDRWIMFNAQCMVGRADSYHFAAIRMQQGEIAFEKPLDVDIKKVTKQAGVPESCLVKTEGGYSVTKATPIQAACVMDVIFRQYLGIRPYTGEGEDYAIGAEW